MATTETNLFPPPTRAAVLDSKGFIGIPFRQWLFSLQMLLPLRLIDTSGGGFAEALPAAGLNPTTGQSNQNQELIYLKTSADANVFTLTGAIDGAHTIATQYGFLRFKSNGVNWYTVAAGTGGATGSVNKFASTIGNGIATTFTVTHGLNTTDVIVQVYETGGSKKQVFPEIDIVNANQISVIFAAPPALNAYRVVVTG